MAQNNEDLLRLKGLSRRALLLGAGQLGLFSLIAGQLYKLQVLESDKYKLLAEDNRINIKLLTPPRGQILDRFGHQLAVNEQNYRVVLTREQSPDVAATLDRLAQILPIGAEERARVLREAKRNRAFVPVTVTENLTWEQVSRIEVNAPDLPGIAIEVGQTRLYPYGPMLSHILGYVAVVSEQELQASEDPLLQLPDFRIGKSGIEKSFDLALRGRAGRSEVEVNAVGRIIRELTRKEGQPGRELVTTLDVGLQNFCYQRLMGETAASAVVMDVTNGDLLALASVPSYDDNAFTKGISAADWKVLVEDPLKPLNNRTIAGTYAPGSTFKMVVALAALEAGISPASTVWCPGVYRLGNAKFHCWKRQGHGNVDMHGGIKHSCDIFFYDLAKRVGIDRIADMAFRLGLGKPTGIELPNEKGGVIPTREWKQANLGEAWQGGETLVTAIGQGFVLATPLQLAVMVARLANGGLAVQPHLARGFRDQGTEDPAPPPAFPPIGVSAEHLAVVIKAMNGVTNEEGGTAYRNRIQEPGWEMAGKTGTSQVRRITLAERAQGVTKNEDLPWHRRDHALFVAFAPVQAPRYACAVVVDHGGGGSAVAAPIVRDILIEAQRRDPLARPALPIVTAANATREG
jgi:penicillin-binding protein 2